MAAIIKGTARNAGSVERVSEGADVFLRMLRDGSLVSSNWKQAAIFQGLGYMVNVGAFSTPIQGGGAGTILDQDQPELKIGIPSGTSVMPIRIEVACVVGAAAAEADETEILIAVDQDNYYTDAGTVETAYNMNTLKGGGSNCDVDSAITSNMSTAPTLDLELAHKVKVVDAITTLTGGTMGTWVDNYLLYEPAVVPIINGPACIYVYWGGTVAATGFCVAQWIEFPTTFSTL